MRQETTQPRSRWLGMCNLLLLFSTAYLNARFKAVAVGLLQESPAHKIKLRACLMEHETICFLLQLGTALECKAVQAIWLFGSIHEVDSTI